MATDSFAPSADVAIRYYDGTGTWASIRAAAAGTDVYPSSDPTSGVYSDASLPLIIRGFLSFDTSTLADGATITAGTLKLYGSSIVGTVGTVDLVAGTPASPTSYVAGDFDQAGTTLLSDTQIAVSSWSTSGYNSFPLNAAGLAAISKTGYTTLAIRHSSDRTGSSPASPAAASYYPVEHTGTSLDPVLEVTSTGDKTVTSPALAVSGAAVAPGVVTHGSAAITDAFTDANNVALTAHTPTGTGSWTETYSGGGTGHLYINNGQVYLKDTSVNTARCQHSTTFTDGFVECDFTKQSGGYGELSIRMTDETHRYFAIYDNGGNTTANRVELYGAGLGVLGYYDTGGFGTTDIVRLEAVGPAIKVYVNGTLRISVTDSTFSASGATALSLNSPSGTTSTGVLADNFIASAMAVTTITAPPLAASLALPAPVVVVPNVTVAAPPLAASAAVPSPAVAGVDGRLRVTGTGNARAASGSRVDTLGGTIGTSSAHRAFPCGALQADGAKRIIYRKATAHSILDGRAVTKTSADGWVTESTISTLLPAGEDDYRSGSLRLLASGRLAHVFFTATTHSSPNYIRGWYSYSDDNGATWATPIRLSNSSFDADAQVPSDVVELADGSLLAFCFGRATFAGSTWDLRCTRSTDGGATWADHGLVAAYSTYSANVVEPQAQVRDDGTVDVTFHIEDGSQRVYLVSSTSSAATAWNTPVLKYTGDTNRSGLLRHPDGDLILAHFPVATFAFRFNQSWDNGASFGSAIDPNSGAASPRYTANVWITPFKIAGTGTSPNVGVVWATENGTQDGADVYYRELTWGATQQAGNVNLAATVTLPTPTVSTTSGSGSVTITAVPLAATVMLSTPVVVTGIPAPPLTATVTLPAPVITISSASSATITAPPLTATVRLISTFVTGISRIATPTTLGSSQFSNSTLSSGQFSDSVLVPADSHPVS